MAIRPGVQGIVWALPGLFLSGAVALVGVAGFATGMPFVLAAEIFGVAVILSVFWLPVILYLAGTRLVLDADQLELRQLFGLRIKRLARAQIGSIAVWAGNAPLLSDPEEDEDVIDPSIPVAYYDVLDKSGRRWTRLRSWVWNRSDCERLRRELSAPPAPGRRPFGY